MTMTLDGPVADTETISDEELAELALAADGDDTVPDDAVPFMAFDGDDGGGLLPSWYMPVAAGRVATRVAAGAASRRSR